MPSVVLIEGLDMKYQIYFRVNGKDWRPYGQAFIHKSQAEDRLEKAQAKLPSADWKVEQEIDWHG